VLAVAMGEPSPVVPLQWTVRGAESVRVDQGAPPPDGATLGYEQVERRDFTLTASNPVGQSVQSLSVYVVRPPSIEEFRADRTEVVLGQSAYLVWRTARALRLFLDDTPLEGALVEAGSLTLDLPETHTFTLRAEDGTGEVQASVTVRVTAPTPTPVPTVRPTPTVRPIPR
jgi:hypothetical protein